MKEQLDNKKYNLNKKICANAKQDAWKHFPAIYSKIALLIQESTTDGSNTTGQNQYGTYNVNNFRYTVFQCVFRNCYLCRGYFVTWHVPYKELEAF